MGKFAHYSTMRKEFDMTMSFYRFHWHVRILPMKRNFMLSVRLWKPINNSTDHTAYLNRCRLHATTDSTATNISELRASIRPQKQNILILVQEKHYFGAEIFFRGIVGNRLVVG